MAADAHRITRVPCDKFLFFVFLAEALKKNKVCPVVEKGPAKFSNVYFYGLCTVSVLQPPFRLNSVVFVK